MVWGVVGSGVVPWAVLTERHRHGGAERCQWAQARQKQLREEQGGKRKPERLRAPGKRDHEEEEGTR